MTIEVSRAGTFSREHPGEKIAEAYPCAEWGSAWLRFVTERGTGNSRYSLRINPNSYADVIRAMLHANPAEAVKAIGIALQDGIPERNLDKYWIPPQAA